MNVFGSFLVLVVLIFYFLHKKGKLRPQIFKMILAIFAILMVAYGVYQLSFASLLRVVYPGSYYTVGGWIAIVLGIIVIISILWGSKKNRA